MVSKNDEDHPEPTHDCVRLSREHTCGMKIGRPKCPIKTMSEVFVHTDKPNCGLYRGKM